MAPLDCCEGIVSNLTRVHLVHFDPSTGQVEGIWFLDESDRPKSLYKDPWGEAAFSASLIMANTVDTVCWYRFWDQLTLRAPYGIWWENVVSDLDPELLLRKLAPLTTGPTRDASGRLWTFWGS